MRGQFLTAEEYGDNCGVIKFKDDKEARFRNAQTIARLEESIRKCKSKEDLKIIGSYGLHNAGNVAVSAPTTHIKLQSCLCGVCMFAF